MRDPPTGAADAGRQLLAGGVDLPEPRLGSEWLARHHHPPFSPAIRGAILRPQSRPGKKARALPASLSGLRLATEKRGNGTGPATTTRARAGIAPPGARCRACRRA